MAGKVTIALNEQLINMGFEKAINEAVGFGLKGVDDFHIALYQRQKDEFLQYALFFHTNSKKEIKLVEVELEITSIAIPEKTIGGLDIKELEARLYKSEGLNVLSPASRMDAPKKDITFSAISDLGQLYSHSKEGKAAAELLMFKFNQHLGIGFSPIDFAFVRQHVSTVTINGKDLIGLTATQMHQNLQNFHYSKQQNNDQSQLKTKNMNSENLQYLSDNIKYMGFGENLKEALEKNMKEGKAEFQLQFATEFGNKPFEATLNFKKSENTGNYFFNSYNASLERSSGEKMEQTFYINKGKGITSKEAFNLLDGRAVHKDLVNKENVPYKAWLQLDFENKDKHNNFEIKPYYEKHGYDLKEAVGKFAIAELKDPDKERALIASLMKGNVQSVTIEKDGSSHKMFIEANPKDKIVNLFDSNMKVVQKEAVGKYQSVAPSTTQAVAVKNDEVQDKKKDLKPDNKQEKAKTQKNNDSLLPKKRESNKKGLGVK
ncbi:hypothetical protein [Ferruginibacter sp.]